MLALVSLTRTIERKVTKIESRPHPDRWVDHMGGGWATASFDAPRQIDYTIEYADGFKTETSRSSEDDNDEFPNVGDTVPFTSVLIPAVPKNTGSEDIPF